MRRRSNSERPRMISGLLGSGCVGERSSPGNTWTRYIVGRGGVSIITVQEQYKLLNNLPVEYGDYYFTYLYLINAHHTSQ